MAGTMTSVVIPVMAERFKKAGLKGKDLLKQGEDAKEEIPESIGLICSGIYCLLLISFTPYLFTDILFQDGKWEGLTRGEFPHQQLASYLGALLSILLAAFLGFLDDVFDIRWRHKLPIPLIASIPLLFVYFVEGGNTHVVVPKIWKLRSVVGEVVDLGPLYYVYMSMLSTFCTNSINILAGLNGLEAAQALIIAISVALNDILYLPWPFTFQINLGILDISVRLGGVWQAGFAYGSKELVDRHLMSLYFMLPLIAICIAFLHYNWYPARVFPGDTLCYFAGMTFAVVGILGHFSKTLLLFFTPQIFNFILSCPQLFGGLPCPRHRVPRVDRKTGLLHPSITYLEHPPTRLQTFLLNTLSTLHLTQLEHLGDANKTIASFTNLTLPNVILLWRGSISEEDVVWSACILQVMASAAAFAVRYKLAGLVYDGDRR
jgi:UDP-N-acetylglucosamine--dolichyl-phosphate N-acetylglucosaminephosphotransferase